METKNTSTLFIATTKMLPIWKRKGVVAREGSFFMEAEETTEEQRSFCYGKYV